jgi:CHAT domain
VWASFRDCAPPLVVLAACHTREVGDALVLAGVRHVVATTGDVVTSDAMAFTRRFYTELVRGASVRDAFAVALMAVGDAHQRSILVLVPAGGDHSVRAAALVIAHDAGRGCLHARELLFSFFM